MTLSILMEGFRSFVRNMAFRGTSQCVNTLSKQCWLKDEPFDCGEGNMFEIECMVT